MSNSKSMALSQDETDQLRRLYSLLYTRFGLLSAEGGLGGPFDGEMASVSSLGVGDAASLHSMALDKSDADILRRVRKEANELSPGDAKMQFRDLWRGGSPDEILVRVLRSNDWSVGPSALDIMKTLKFRAKEFNSQRVLERGEIYYFETAPDRGYQKLCASGIKMFAGRDKDGRPIIVIRGSKLNPRAQSLEMIKNFILLQLEVVVTALRTSSEGAVVVFDLKGFGFSNFDLKIIKFMIFAFEAQYPQIVSNVLIHRAPKIFEGMWKLIRPWLSKSLARKVHFTYKAEHLLDVASIDQFPSLLGGPPDLDDVWIPPQAEDDILLKDVSTRYNFAQERARITQTLERATVAWLMAESPAAEQKAADERAIAQKELREVFWKSEPYNRSRISSDRNGSLHRLRPDIFAGSDDEEPVAVEVSAAAPVTTPARPTGIAA